MDYTYTYLFLTLFFGIFWLIFFLLRKNNRLEMVYVGLLGAIIGPFTEFFYYKDYWKPITLTNTVISIESFLTGFFFLGVASVIYEDIFRKKFKGKPHPSYKRFLFVVVPGIILFFGLSLWLTNSFIASIVAFGVPTAIMLIQRTDLIKDSLFSGLLFVSIAMIVYFVVNLITPGWVEVFFLFQNTPKIMILSLPIDDFFWYLFAGMVFGPAYEYWQGLRLK